MILIFSEEGDISTDCAIEWLHYFGQQFIRINKPNHHNVITEISIQKKDSIIHFDNNSIKLDELQSVWYRRGELTFEYDFAKITDKSEQVKRQVSFRVQQEVNTISSFVYTVLAEKYTIGNPLKYNLNKLEILRAAAIVGLKVPDTLVSNNQAQVNEFIQRRKGVITKPLSNNVDITEDGRTFSTGTQSINKVPEQFYYSLFQEKINRFCEIRTFYVEDEFFSMAIFVDKTLDDARSLILDGNKARLVPFKLPPEIIEKLRQLAKVKNINSGSVDMILTPEGEYYFLEINPVGQYDYLEKACNYPISRTIAEKLSNRYAKAI